MTWKDLYVWRYKPNYIIKKINDNGPLSAFDLHVAMLGLFRHIYWETFVGFVTLLLDNGLLPAADGWRLSSVSWL